MKGKSVDLFELLRRVRQSAGDQRKIFLAFYGLLLFLVLGLVVLAAGRAALQGSFPDALAASFLRPFLTTVEFFRGAWQEGAWGLMALVGLGYRSLSMPPAAVGPVKAMVRSVEIDALERYLREQIRSSRRSIRENLLSFARDHGIAV